MGFGEEGENGEMVVVTDTLTHSHDQPNHVNTCKHKPHGSLLVVLRGVTWIYAWQINKQVALFMNNLHNRACIYYSIKIAQR